MSLKLIRIARLKEFATNRGLVGPVAIGQAIGKKANQASDLINGKAPFGEKVARSIEAFAGLPENWLDSSSDANVPEAEGALNPRNAHEEIASDKAITLDAAIARVAQHLENLNGYNPATAASLFTTLANDPSMAGVVATGLHNLKSQARVALTSDAAVSGAAEVDPRFQEEINNLTKAAEDRLDLERQQHRSISGGGPSRN